jgi:hypothetical protein
MWITFCQAENYILLVFAGFFAGNIVFIYHNIGFDYLVSGEAKLFRKAIVRYHF